MKSLEMRRGVSTLFLFSLLLLFLFCPRLIAGGVSDGLLLSARTLIPSLFPFLVLSEVMVGSGAAAPLGRLFARPAARLLGLSQKGTGVAILSLLCGFPTGVCASLSLLERGEISKEEFCRLFLFINTPSAGFLIGTVGAGLFDSVTLGAALFFITLSSSLLVGILLRLFYGAPAAPPKRNAECPPLPLTEAFLLGVRRALTSLFSVCAFVLFFSALSACLHALPLPDSLSLFLCGVLEMTCGISRTVSSLPAALAFPAVAFFTSFSGLSVCAQLFSLSKGAGPRPAHYLFLKLFSACLSFLLAASVFRFLG